MPTVIMLSVVLLSVIQLNISELCVNMVIIIMLCSSAECHYAECFFFSVILASGIHLIDCYPEWHPAHYHSSCCHLTKCLFDCTWTLW